MLHLKWAKELREHGKKLGREGMSKRVIELVDDFVKKGGGYKAAMILAGRLKAIGQAAKCDDYWDEQVSKGFHREMGDLTRLSVSEIPACPKPTKEIKLGQSERTVLALLYEQREWVFPFSAIANYTHLNRVQVKRAARGLGRKGLAIVSTAYSEDTGLLCGGGYMITGDGERYFKAILEEEGGS